MRLARASSLYKARKWASDPGRCAVSLTDSVVLGRFPERPRDGFDIARELRPESPIGQIWNVSRPPVYRAIAHLAGEQLIEPIRIEPGSNGPDRTVYQITRAGKRQV